MRTRPRSLALEEAFDLFRSRRRRTDRLQAELAIEIGSRRVVDPADHLFDAELVLGELGGHDIGRVSVGNGDERLRPIGSGPAEDILVDGGAEDHFAGEILTEEQWKAHEFEWLPSPKDYAYVQSLMSGRVAELGKFANWIAPPVKGVNGQPLDFQYVRFN